MSGPSGEKDVALAYRVCVECGTRWTAINDPVGSAPIDCPECGSGSVDAEIQAALAIVEPWAVEAIRRDERARLSALLKDNAETVGNFAGAGPNTARLIAYMVSLGSSSQTIGIEPGPDFNPPDMALDTLAAHVTPPADPEVAQ